MTAILRSPRLLLLFVVPVALLLFGGVSCTRPKPDRGILRSVDSGATWEQKTRVGEDKTIAGRDFLDIQVSPHDGSVILAGGIESGVWVSTNGAETWSATNLTQPTVKSVAFSAVTEGVVYASGELGGIGKIYKSEDNGSTWSEVFSATHRDQRVEVIQVDWYNDEIVYAGTQDNAILKSIDSGENWLVNTRFPSVINDIEISLDDSRLIYAATDGSGLWRTTDAGATEWVRLLGNEDDGGFTRTSRVFDVEVDPALPSIVYAASRHGLTRSRDSGDTWEDVPLLVSPGSISQLRIALDPFSFQPVYVAIDSSFYASDNFGETWDPQKVTNHKIRALAIDPNDPQTLYMGIQEAK